MRIHPFSILLIILLSTIAAPQAHAYDWKDLLKNAGKGSAPTGQTNSDSTTGTASPEGQASSLLSGLASFIGDATGLNKLKAEDLVGTWRYAAPAVAFQSENLLQKAGGAAAATVIIDKIAPYYERFGLNRTVFTFNRDSTMTMSIGRLSVKGTYALNEDGSFTFDMQLGGRSIKKLQAFVTRQVKNICVTFDASGLISLMNTVASLTGNTTAKGLADILNSYDGLTVGFEMTGESAQADTAKSGSK